MGAIATASTSATAAANMVARIVVAMLVFAACTSVL